MVRDGVLDILDRLEFEPTSLEHDEKVICCILYKHGLKEIKSKQYER